MQVVAGVDLGGTAINYTLVDSQEQFLIEGLCEHPALSKQGPEVCLKQIEDGLRIAAERAKISFADIVVVGLDTPVLRALPDYSAQRDLQISSILIGADSISGKR